MNFPVFVLFEIAKRWPPAHRAFLVNKHYRKQYNDKGAWKAILGEDWKLEISRFSSNRYYISLLQKGSSFFPSSLDIRIYYGCSLFLNTYEVLASWGIDDNTYPDRRVNLEFIDGEVTHYSVNGDDKVNRRCLSNSEYATYMSDYINTVREAKKIKFALAQLVLRVNSIISDVNRVGEYTFEDFGLNSGMLWIIQK